MTPEHLTPRPLLPPRGIFLPTRLIFDDQLKPAALQTWAQLRALAWGRQETPILSLQQIYEVTGKKPSTLYGHMAILRDRGALRWRPAGSGTLIVSFPEPELSEVEAPVLSSGEGGYPVDDFPDDSENLEILSENPGKFSRNLEMPSLNPSSLQPGVSAEDTERGSGLQNSGKNSQDKGESCEENELIFQKPGTRVTRQTLHKSRKSLQESGKGGAESAGPVQLYRRLTHISPNPSQRLHIQNAVSDSGLWEASLTHWLAHGWNPRNLPGLLDLYARGGPAACRYCQENHPKTNSPAPSILDQNLAALDDLRKELTHG